MIIYIFKISLCSCASNQDSLRRFKQILFHYCKYFYYNYRIIKQEKKLRIVFDAIVVVVAVVVASIFIILFSQLYHQLKLGKKLRIVFDSIVVVVIVVASFLSSYFYNYINS